MTAAPAHRSLGEGGCFLRRQTCCCSRFMPVRVHSWSSLLSSEIAGRSSGKSLDTNLKLARLPTRSALPLRAFAFYLGNPSSSIETRSFPSSLAATLAALPSMSLIPSAPFTNGHQLLQREGNHGYHGLGGAENQKPTNRHE